MSALTADREMPEALGEKLSYPVKGGVEIFVGALVAAVAGVGLAQPATAATNLVFLGGADGWADNTDGVDGAKNLRVRRGLLAFNTPASGGDAITAANVGAPCYAMDDNNLGLTNGSGTRSCAGNIVKVDADGVWIWVGVGAPPSGALAPVNNLSDVASAATARANLGANKTTLLKDIANLATAGATYLSSTVAGVISKILVTLQGALATGNATVQVSIGGVNVTAGLVTCTQVGSAAGNVYSATPSALNTVAVGSSIGLTVAGTNTGAVVGTVQLEIDT